MPGVATPATIHRTPPSPPGPAAPAPRVAVDLVLLSRAEELLAPQRRPVLERMLGPDELAGCTRQGHLDASALAGVLAVKEAVFKLFHVRDRPVPWLSIEVVSGPGSWPEVHLRGTAAQLAGAARLVSEISVSLAHDGGYAVAVAAAVHATEG